MIALAAAGTRITVGVVHLLMTGSMLVVFYDILPIAILAYIIKHNPSDIYLNNSFHQGWRAYTRLPVFGDLFGSCSSFVKF